MFPTDHYELAILDVLANAHVPLGEIGVAGGNLYAVPLDFGLERQTPGAATGRQSGGPAIAASILGAAYRSAIDYAAGSFDQLRHRLAPVIGCDEQVVDFKIIDWVAPDGGTAVVVGRGVVTARGSIGDSNCFPVPAYSPVADRA